MRQSGGSDSAIQAKTLRPSPDDAALLMSLRGDAGAAQSSAQAAGPACAVLPAQAPPQVSTNSSMYMTLHARNEPWKF